MSTESYAFIVLLNVALLGIAGLVGLGFLLKALKASARAQEESERAAEPPAVHPPITLPEGELTPARYAARQERARDPVRDATRERETSAQWIFRVWVIIYGLVGAQMGWVLRPFIGAPGTPFAWLRPRDGNFFRSIGQALSNLMGL